MMNAKKIVDNLNNALANSETFEDFLENGLVEITYYRELETGVKKDEMFYKDTQDFAREIWDKNEEEEMPF